MTGLQRTAEPNSEPLDLSEVKAHLRIGTSSDDALLANLVTVARQACEDHIRRALVTQGWTLWLDTFPAENIGWWDGVREGAALTIKRFIYIPRPPLQAIVAVTTYDDANTATAFGSDQYFVDTASEPGRLALRNNAVWPEPGRSHHGIGIEFTAGYGDAGNVPQALKQGMLAHIAQLYEERGELKSVFSHAQQVKLLPDISRSLYMPYRIQHLVLP
jgi:uncharacterized phiE125 gp8 family phage protein